MPCSALILARDRHERNARAYAAQPPALTEALRRIEAERERMALPLRMRRDLAKLAKRS